MIKVKDIKVFPRPILDVLTFRMVGRSMNLKGMQMGSKTHCLPCEHWSRHLGKRNLGGKKEKYFNIINVRVVIDYFPQKMWYLWCPRWLTQWASDRQQRALRIASYVRGFHSFGPKLLKAKNPIEVPKWLTLGGMLKRGYWGKASL